MNDPLRLREELPGEAASVLLDHARADAPPAGFRSGLLSGLGLGVSVAGSAGAGIGSAASSAGKASASSSGLSFGKLLIGLGVLSLAGGLIWKTASEPGERSPRLRTLGAIGVVGSVANEIIKPAPQAADRKVPEVLDEGVNATNNRQPTATPARAKAEPSSSVGKSRLGDEVIALDEARRALSGKDTEGALAQLADYDRKFPAARLAPEATILRIEALLARGEHARAASLAAKFRSAHPKSPHARRIDSLLARPKSGQGTKP